MKKKLKTVFFGNNPQVFQLLVDTSHVVAALCRNSTAENVLEVKKIAELNKIPLIQVPKKELLQSVNKLEKLNPDLFIVCGYKYIIQKEIFNIPKYGTINIHASYLPKYRGQHVINWAIVNGEKETGVTLHYIDEGIDTGDIISQKKILIEKTDTGLSLHIKMYNEACKLLSTLLDDFNEGREIRSFKQDDLKATFFSPRVPEDGRIIWNKRGHEIENLVKGLVKPWPGAYSYLEGKKVIFWDVLFEKCMSSEPNGKIISVFDSSFVVAVKDGKLIVKDYDVVNENNEVILYDIPLKKMME